MAYPARHSRRPVSGSGGSMALDKEVVTEWGLSVFMREWWWVGGWLV